MKFDGCGIARIALASVLASSPSRPGTPGRRVGADDRRTTTRPHPGCAVRGAARCQCVTTMLSTPIGLVQQIAAGFERRMTSVSITSAACGFTTVAKFPKVFGSVAAIVNVVVEFRRPVIVYGIGVVLE